VKPSERAADLLAGFDLAIFERIGEGRFRLFVKAPTWTEEAFPGSIGEDPWEITDAHPYLFAFLFEAEEYWKQRPPKQCRSGIWMEPHPERGELPLEAIACFQGDTPVLILQGLQSFFSETERMLQLSREHLLAKEALEKESERKQVLVHCVVHDLHSPLSTLKLALEQVRCAEDPESRERFLEMAERQVERQIGLVDDILQAYKAETQAISAGADQVMKLAEVVSCLETVGKDLEVSLRRKRLEFVLELDPALDAGATVRGTPDRLRRLVFNIADNAVRIAPRKSQLKVALLPDAEGGLRIHIDDQGPGLSPNAEFEIFHRMRQGRGGKGKVGLGLYYCRMTARAWGGEVNCLNLEEGGARFWVRLVSPLLL
jgi:signal transduction histidine kinase